MIPAAQKDQVDIQGQVSPKSELLSHSQIFPEKQVQSNHEKYHSKASDQDQVVAGGKSSFENVYSQCQASAKEHAQTETMSSHRAAPSLQGQIFSHVRTSKSQERLVHNVSSPQIGNSFQNSNTCKVKVEVPVG